MKGSCPVWRVTVCPRVTFMRSVFTSRCTSCLVWMTVVLKPPFFTVSSSPFTSSSGAKDTKWKLRLPSIWRIQDDEHLSAVQFKEKGWIKEICYWPLLGWWRSLRRKCPLMLKHTGVDRLSVSIKNLWETWTRTAEINHVTQLIEETLTRENVFNRWYRMIVRDTLYNLVCTKKYIDC